MKRNLKLTLGVLALGIAAVGLTSCTASFCSVADKSSVMYAYDVYNIEDKDGKDTGKLSFGISTYYDKGDPLAATNNAVPVEGFDNLLVSYNINSNLAIKQINEGAKKDGIPMGDYQLFWATMDNHFLNDAITAAAADGADAHFNLDKATMGYNDVVNVLIGNKEGNYKGYGYTKYAGTNSEGNPDYWQNWDKTYDIVRSELKVDNCPGKDYVTYLKRNYQNFAAAANSCLASTDGFYGYYGFNNDHKREIFMEKKDWNYAWSKGFFEGFLVYPIGWLIDATTTAFMGAGGGVAQVLAILVITFLIRAVMMVFTINQTTQTAKMSEIQPEITKIQQKYPNANTNKSEQMTMASELQALYKKYKIHPFTSILVMILQFPVFICVWGAMTGSSVLASDTFLGLRLSNSVSQTLFDVTGLPNNPGWWTALVLFIVMAGLQVVSMLLPQIIQKKKAKKVAKTGRNPNVNAQNSKMKWFTIIMMIMVIIMGFSLASGMVIYWIAGSIWTIAQTLIIELVNYLKKNHKNKPRKPRVAVAGSANGQILDAEIIPESFQAPTGKKKYKAKKPANSVNNNSSNVVDAEVPTDTKGEDATNTK